jgi:ATP-dependent RNA helicase DeaD
MSMRLQFGQTDIADSFDLLGLPVPLVRALDETGYEVPSRVQVACIPPLLMGRDLLAHTHTGTGKTLAFVLPLLAAIELERRQVQALVLTPDDETSLHVCEVFQSYARHLEGFHVLPVYHQTSAIQLRQLQRGCHVVVGTPPRLAHYLADGYFAVDDLRTLVMDEVDTMLREGMVDTLREILAQLPHRTQTAMFTASMFRELQMFAAECLSEPHGVDDMEKPGDLPSLRQRYWQVDGRAKLNALARVIEIEPGFDAGLVFVHHRNTASLLTEKLRARGYAVEQVDSETLPHQRLGIAEKLAGREADILVVTDNAAWKVRTPRFTHVISFDMPVDIEAHVHRLRHLDGAENTRTAIFLVTAREMDMLHCIEQATGQPIKALELPERPR